jgi:hypothetical protein
MNRNIFLLLLIILFTLNGCAGLKQGPEVSTVKIKGKKEILVAKDIGKGSGAYPVLWCGNDAIVAYNEEMGIELIKVPNGERVRVSPNESDYPFNCSPDGEWIVYMDRASTRLDKADKVMEAEDYGFDPELDVWPVWEGYVADLYRYNVATGKRQRFAVVRSELPSWEVVSPDGLKVFLGSKHNSYIEMPEPKWEAVWFTREDWDWNQTGALWFKDSSGVVSYGHNSTNRVFVEFFGENGWAKRFVPDEGLENNIENLAVDGENRVYFLIKERGYVPIEVKGKWFMYRCVLKDKDLSCEMVLERNRYIISYKILPDGYIVFSESDDNCLRLISPRHTDSECVAGDRRPGEIYLIGISPDGRQVAYETFNDLYVVEIIR